MKMPAKRRPTHMRYCVQKIIEYIQITTEDLSSLVDRGDVVPTLLGLLRDTGDQLV